MSERTVTVASRSGLHARPAAMFVKAATAQPVPVRLRVGDGPAADARSILAVLALRVEHGTTVTLIAPDQGADADAATAAEQALDALADLLARDLDAEPAETKPSETGPTNAEPPAPQPAAAAERIDG